MSMIIQSSVADQKILWSISPGQELGVLLHQLPAVRAELLWQEPAGLGVPGALAD